MKDLAHLRKSYERAELDESHAASAPLRQFETWLEDAVKANVPEPTAMTLATVGEGGRPSTRPVLLKGADANGFVWYTNYESRKGQELSRNPHAALQFHWVEQERVVRIEGTVAATSAEESDAYFAQRPLDSRIGAWASPQSRVIASRAVLVAEAAKLRRALPAAAAAPAALGRLPAHARPVRILARPGEPPARPPALHAAARRRVEARAARAVRSDPRSCARAERRPDRRIGAGCTARRRVRNRGRGGIRPHGSIRREHDGQHGAGRALARQCRLGGRRGPGRDTRHIFGGAMAGRVLHRAWPEALWLPLLLEALLIAVAAFVDPARAWAIWLVAAAMGIQATVITKVGGMAISTVVVTSTMARLAERAVDALARSPRAVGPGPDAPTGLALAWGSYAVGAVAAALLMKATALPLLVSAGVVLVVSLLWMVPSPGPARD